MEGFKKMPVKLSGKRIKKEGDENRQYHPLLVLDL
jgi:hypothetical protein